VTDDYSKIFLFNHVLHLKQLLQQFENEKKIKDNSNEGLLILMNTYRQNPAQGDPETVFEVLLNND
jgi:hypothetical protein